MEQTVLPSELHLLCSYDGENRIIAVERRCSLSQLLGRLVSTFFKGEREGGRSFTLKYQLPNHQGQDDLFITIKSDEDLKSMIHEYDRSVAPTASSSTMSSQRIRLFLFPTTPPPMPAPTLTSSCGTKKVPRRPVVPTGSSMRRSN